MMYSDPVPVSELFSNAMNDIEDSIEINRLKLFYGCCHYLNGNIDSAMIVNNEVVNFCRKKESELLNSDIDITYYYRLKALEANCYNHQSVYLQELNERDSAICLLHKAYDAVYCSDKRSDITNICINLADIYLQ